MIDEPIRQLIHGCEDMLREVWEARNQDSDIIVLSDTILSDAIVSETEPPMTAFVEPRMWISKMIRADDQDVAEIGEKIRVIRAGFDDNGSIVVPVLVDLREKTEVIGWEPPADRPDYR